jgi:GGDEF domain-containing protein
MAEDRRLLPARLIGALLVGGSALLAASSVPGVPTVAEPAGYALVGAAIAAFADLRTRGTRFRALVLVAVLFIVGDRLAESGVADDRPWVVAASFGTYLGWRALAATPRSVLLSAVPTIAAVAAPLALRGAGASGLALGVLVGVAGVVAALGAVLVGRLQRRRDEVAQNQRDVDAVVLANLELRNVGEARDAATRIARIATELLDAEGAVVWLQGPGRLLCAGGHGTTPPPEREVADGSIVERVLLSGSVATDRGGEVVLPLTGSGGVFGAVTVSGPRRTSATFVTSVLQVFGAQAGYALERLRAVESLIDARFVDPVTGVGNRLAATASLATLHNGDALLLLAVDELAAIRERDGDGRADLILGQLGLHLRTATRAGDLIARFGDDVFFVLLRDLNASAESVVTRLLDSWQATGTAGTLRAGAAIHFADTTPLDTLDRATEALDAARLDHRGERDPIAAAAERATWGPG